MRHQLLRAAVTGVAAFCLVLSARAQAQVAPAAASPRARSGRDFPVERFEEVSSAAVYLAAYDQVAWVTSDSVLALIARDSTIASGLGVEWYAFQQDSAWHAVYGGYDQMTDRYVQVAHYVRKPDGVVQRSSARVDSLLARRYGRAISLTFAKIPEAAQKTRARFNTYVRPTKTGELELWYLPAWQPNGWLIHGMEFYFRVDSSGRRVVDSSSVMTPLRGGTPDTTQVIDIYNDARDVPTVGQAFFALYYGSYFKSVYIHSRDFVSTYFNKDGKRAWMHALRQGPKAAADTTR